MKFEIKVPSVGESVTSADIESWEKRSGDLVKKGEVLVILETDKASMEIPAERAGALQIVKNKGETVSVGDTLGFIDDSAALAAQAPPPSGKTADQNIKARADGLSKLQSAKEALSPAVRRLVETSAVDVSQIQGTGKGGRLTKEDILTALKEGESSKEAARPVDESLSREPQSAASIPPALTQKPDLKQGQRREPMTRLRKATARRLVQSLRSTASLSTFNEADLSRIIEIRKSHQEEFIKKYGFKLGFMSFFVRAVVAALKAYPKLNAFVDEDDIIYNDHQHIGIAISLDRGLVVPVIFKAETLSLAEIEKKILEYRDKALARKLSPDELLGGTFTVSNGGVFGSLLSTPILNPPQSGILGMHKIEQRPVARNGKVEIRPMMSIALSYDHRIVDGRESVSFLVKVKEALEEPARLLIDI